MKLSELYEYMKELAPLSLAESWDNPGLLVRSGERASRVLVCLDIKKETLQEAEKLSCDVIVSHHPVIFSPLKTVDRDSVVGRLVSDGISAICMHTNLDAADGGVNDTLAALFQLRDAEPFGENMGRIGNIDPCTVSELAVRAASVLHTPVKYADGGHLIRRLAVISGAGGSMLQDAIHAGADCLLTGEANHHAAIDARAAEVSLIAATHYATEFPVTEVLAQKLKSRFGELTVFVSREDHDPFLYI